MDIVIGFKNYLSQKKNPPSSITIKNYLSDVRKFISWFEESFNTHFSPLQLTPEVIYAYQNAIHAGNSQSIPAARSAKRYLSSLRKFATFLEESGTIPHNPFTRTQPDQTTTDPFFFKEFKNYLFTDHASKLTIKNYIADIKQFIQWFEEVASLDSQTESSTLLPKIDNFALEEYKQRLLREVQLSPLSINRKLSSLRRYLRWLGDKGIIKTSFMVLPPEQKEQKSTKQEQPITQDLPLRALQELMEEKEEKKASSYSSFAPLRLAQKTTKLITLSSDLLFFNPIAEAVQFMHYSLWKKGKKKIFAPVATIIETSSNMPKGAIIKTIIPKGASILPPRSANLNSVITKIAGYKKESSPDYVKNFTKALYAPLKMSTKHMSWKERLLFTIRYIRPAWYRAYHSFAFVTYLHFAILVLASAIAGTALYLTWNEPIKHNQAVLAEQSQAPPRMLSFQGRLLDSKNIPITAETPLRFALYNSPTATGAARLWQESQDIKPDRNGYFSATLGKINQIDQSLFKDNASLYIGIAVKDNQELRPRQEIPTANYAANSQAVQGLKPITDSPDLAQNVLLALDSSGNLTIGGTSSHTFQTTGGQFTLSGQTLLLTTTPGSNGNVQISPDGSGIIDLQKPIQNTSNYNNPSGIQGAVEVDDILSVLATSSSQSALIVNQNGSNDIISGRRNGIDKFRVDGAGNEYLAGNLILNGDTIGTNSTVFDIGGSIVNDLRIGTNASVISLGKSSSGVTSINNSLSVHGTSTFAGPVNTFGPITANAGLTIASGSGKLTLSNFTPGAIPFIDATSAVVQDAANFSWNDTNKALNVNGSICLYSHTSCDSSHDNPGTIYFDNAHAFSGDVAENYVSSQNLEPGDVVVLEGKTNNNAIVKSATPYQPELLGVVSTQPGLTLNTQASTDPQHPNIYPLALSGRVPVKVSSINGPIKPGDDLTSSPFPGVAMKAIGPGQTIGKALETYTSPDASASGKIMAFIALSYRNSATTLTDTGNFSTATGSAMQTSNYQSGSINSLNDFEQQLLEALATLKISMLTAEDIATQSLTIATDNIKIEGQTLRNYISGIVEQILTQELDKRLSRILKEKNTIDRPASNSASITDQTASISATPTPSSSTSANIQIGETLMATNSAILNSSPAASLYNSIASTSAVGSAAATPTPSVGEPFVISSNSGTASLSEHQAFINSNPITNTYAPLANANQLTYVPNFKSDFATFTQGLIALGPTSLTDVGVSDMITVNNNLKITQNSIDTLGSDLAIEPLRQGNISFMGGLVSIDTQGNLKVNGDALFAQNVTINGQLSTGIIAPVPDQNLVINLKNKANNTGSSLVITNATGSAALQINQAGDVASSGEASFGSIISNGLTIVRGAQADTSVTETIANGSAGNGVIEPFQTERTIITPYVTDHSLIYITPTSNTSTLTPYLARQTAQDLKKGSKGSFTVAIPTQATAKISFNWWIVN